MGMVCSKRGRTFLRKSWRSLMSCWLTKESSVLRRERKIGLKKEDASGCKRGEMKSRGAEMRLPKEKEKKERLEKQKRGKGELKKRKKDALILRKLNKRKEKKRERIETEKAQRENDVTNRDRMQRMIADKDVYLDGLLKERKNIFEKKLEEFNVMLADERKQR